MKHHLEPERNPKSHQKTSDDATLPQASHKIKLQDRISSQHCNATKDFQNAPPVSSVSHSTQQVSGKTHEDELVRYMSNMPSYLEKGKKPKEKVLSVGVLDWGRLEKWQSVHKVAPHRYSGCSPSSSNTSSSYSADCSTSDSSRGQSYSPARQRSRCSLKFHLTASPLKDHSSAVKVSGESKTNRKDLKFAKSGDLNQHDNFNGTLMPFPRNHPDTNLKQDREKESKVSGTEYNISSDMKKYKEVSNVKRQVVMGQVEKMEGKPKQKNMCAANLDAPRPIEPVSVQRELPETKKPGACHLSDSRPILGLRSEEASKTFPEKLQNICNAKFVSDASKSYAVPEETVNSINLRVKPQSVGAERFHQSSDAHQLVSRSAEVGISPSPVENSQKKKLSTTPAIEVPRELDQKLGKSIVEKPRSTSPFRRLSINLTNVGKSSSTKEDEVAPQSMSKSQTSKCNSENGTCHTCPDDLFFDRPCSAARSRSSPLRRLLDPLLKPKGSHRLEHLQRGSTSTDGACKLSDAQLEHSSIHSITARFDISSCKTADINGLGNDKKNGSVVVQALVRVAFKNGLPLITFAVGSDSNVYIATVKTSGSSDKNERTWAYTIFNVQDVKKKSGSRRSQVSKGKCPGYVPKVIAEMNVYDSSITNSTREDSQGLLRVRQFVSFSMDLRTDKKASDFQPNDEVAAIVMQIPEKGIKPLSRGESPGASNFYTDLGQSMQNVMSPDSREPINATVILPSGIHSLPSRGIPSSLVDRWKSGGSCDCGGWDLGCKLTILSNQDSLNKKLNLSKACSVSSRFELFSEGGQQYEPIFCFAPFKDGAFSVDFSSSLSLVQAFSICLAILDCSKLLELPESEAKALAGTESVHYRGMQTEGGIPARHVSYPPISPVERV